MENTKKTAEKALKKKSGLIFQMYDKGVFYFLLSFLIPFIVMIGAWKVHNVHMLWFADGKFQATGDNQFLVVDLWHQYYPFFRVLREKLLDGGSMLYSWQNGIGTNFLALIAYYETSPLNLLSVFFSEEYTREAFMYFLAAKLGLCGAFFNCFLRYTFKSKDMSTVGFSVMYALCSYMMGYYWNVMWFDTIALFPLVMLGVVAMCRERKWKLYTVALALSLITNYYIGFFTCIFTIFMFAFTAIIEWQGFKAFFIRLWLIIRSSVIGICAGGFILLPAYKALQLTHGVNNTMPATIKWEHSWQEIFANLVSYKEPTSIEGLPNFACGMLAVTLIGVFIFSAGIKIREKISAVLLLALIAVSCNMNKLNFIWHGFHTTNQLPYRYAFIFSFILVVAAYRAYDAMTEKGIRLYHLPMLLIGPAAVFYMYYLTNKPSDGDFDFKDKIFISAALITGVYIIIFIFMKFIPIKDKGVLKGTLNLILTVTIIVEMAANADIGIAKVGTSDYDTYPSYAKECEHIIEEMESRENPLFYRAEMTSTYTLNDGSLYGYNGISQFSSSANVSVTKFLNKMGMYASNAGNRYYYRTATPVVNSVLGVKYLISKLGTMKSGSAFLEQVAEQNSVNLYENKYPLSLGFMMDKRILEFNPNAVNTFEFQNMFMKNATGEERGPFAAQPVYMVTYNNVTADKEGYGEYNYSIDDKDKPASVVYQFEGVSNGYLYGYCKGKGIEKINVFNDDEKIENDISVKGYSIAFPMGDGKENTTVSVELVFEDDADFGNYTLVVYSVNESIFSDLYDNLADEQLEITEFKDTKIKGNITAKEDGAMFLSIPYEKGWSVYVDGKNTDTFPIADAMLGVEVSAGKHEIELKYIPEGFVVGILATGGAVLLFILFAICDSRRKKKHGGEPVELTVDNGKMDDISSGNAVSDLGFTANIKDMPHISENTENNVPETVEIAEKSEKTEEENEESESSDSLQGN